MKSLRTPLFTEDVQWLLLKNKILTFGLEIWTKTWNYDETFRVLCCYWPYWKRSDSPALYILNVTARQYKSKGQGSKYEWKTSNITSSHCISELKASCDVFQTITKTYVKLISLNHYIGHLNVAYIFYTLFWEANVLWN